MKQKKRETIKREMDLHYHNLRSLRGSLKSMSNKDIQEHITDLMINQVILLRGILECEEE